MMSSYVAELHRAIDQAMLRDQPRLRRTLAALNHHPDPKRLKHLHEAIVQSQARRAMRQTLRPQPTYPSELPIIAKRNEIMDAIATHPVVIVCGETGSGKTTQLPKFCLELGRGVAGLIGHTQPRRLAARSVAARIAAELNTSLGEAIGYTVRFTDQVGANTFVKLMTDGILLAEVQQDRDLYQYDTLIIDEAHERSLNIDFLLGYLKRLFARRADLKVIITSATINPQGFSQFFDSAPIIEISGRGYPVEVRYRSLDDDAREQDQEQAILTAIHELSMAGPGDILVFLPGEREIRDTAQYLRRHLPPDTELLPLYARLAAGEQQRIFKPHSRRRIVLATNVAETSLTVPGIRYVIDTGTARISRYSARTKVQRLPIEPVSQAAANQRAGRCGRVAPGICIRLYSEADFAKRIPFTEPEVLRTNLAAVILTMAHLKLGDIECFPFPDPPAPRLIKDGYVLLQELNALDVNRHLTNVGHRLARLPIEPRLARVLLAASIKGCLQEALIIAGALSVQDPRERPHDQREAADQQHALFADARSDFLFFVNLWRRIHEEGSSSARLRRFCQVHFLSYPRVREWRDIYRQLHTIIRDEFKFIENREPADYASLHRALLTGFASHLGYKTDTGDYAGARGRCFRLFPGSGIKKTPPWLMAAELIETHRLYAHTVAAIDPVWAVDTVPHLLKREYFEPHWQMNRAQVAAFERITLYGLVLIPRRRVDYGRVEPLKAREIFIREALIAGRWAVRLPVLEHNRNLIESVEGLEARVRQSLLIDDARLYAFYAERLPEDIHNGPTFERWARQDDNTAKLKLTREILLGEILPDIAPYPPMFEVSGMHFVLEYRFAPGAEDDGVTVTLPLALLNQLDDGPFEWLVPGLREEKITALIKGLPKRLRRNFAPTAEFARAATQALTPDQGPFLEVLGQKLAAMTGVQVPPEAWTLEALPPHLRMRFKIIGPNDQMLAAGRDLKALKAELGSKATEGFVAQRPNAVEKTGLTDWAFDRLPAFLAEGGAVKPSSEGFIAVIDEGASVALKHVETPEMARRQTRVGFMRLFYLRLSQEMKYLYKNLPDSNRMCLHYQSLGRCEELKQAILETSIARVFLEDQSLLIDKAAFEARLNDKRTTLIPTALELVRLIGDILRRYHDARQRLSKVRADQAILDIEQQLAHLVFPGFIQQTPAQWLAHLPRYLDAITVRLDKRARDPNRDALLLTQVQPFWTRYLSYIEDDDTGVTNNNFLTTYRFMIEEYRVSLFAQELGTAVPVSPKRLEAQWTQAITAKRSVA